MTGSHVKSVLLDGQARHEEEEDIDGGDGGKGNLTVSPNL